MLLFECSFFAIVCSFIVAFLCFLNMLFVSSCDCQLYIKDYFTLLYFTLTLARPGLFYTLVWPRGGVKLPPTHISSSKPHRNEIPTATPLFSTMPDSTVPSPTFSDSRYFRNSRWRMENWKYTGSLEWNDISAKFQRQTPHFRLSPTSW